MLGFLSRIIGYGEVDGAAMARHTYGMPADLSAVDVHTDDVGDYNVTEPGWYAVDDAGKVVLGPFDSLKQCESAIAERKRMTGAAS